jgi:glycosyltransferase involved in cell wall biosynthesis
MRVVFLTGIWPPDVGGPATHGPDFAAFLRDRGHEVRVVTMGDSDPTERPVPVESVSRGRPFVIRYPLVASAGLRLARHADVVYATATYAAAAAAARGARRPLVAKLVSDPAYERAVRYGLFDGTLEDFQRDRSARTMPLKRLRNVSLRTARHVVVPSRYLARIAGGWGLEQGRIEVLTNPAPPPQDVAPDQLPAGTFVYVGRLSHQKGLPVALEALREVPEARLVLVGDGPEREHLQRLATTLGLDGRVEFAGARPRDQVLRTVAGATALVLPSAWENLPHAAVEALSVGTPVVATAVGGVPEVVHDGENGLLVPAGDSTSLAAAMRALLNDEQLLGRLARAARPSVEAIGREPTYARLERILVEAIS